MAGINGLTLGFRSGVNKRIHKHTVLVKDTTDTVSNLNWNDPKNPTIVQVEDREATNMIFAILPDLLFFLLVLGGVVWLHFRWSIDYQGQPSTCAQAGIAQVALRSFFPGRTGIRSMRLKISSALESLPSR